jgi:hypothetical protein
VTARKISYSVIGAADRPPRPPDEPAGSVVVGLRDFRGFRLRPDGPAQPVGFVSAEAGVTCVRQVGAT